MDNDFTLFVVTVAVIIFAAFVYRSVMSDFRNGIRRY